MDIWVDSSFYEVLSLCSVIAWNQQVSDSKAPLDLMGQRSALPEEEGLGPKHKASTQQAGPGPPSALPAAPTDSFPVSLPTLLGTYLTSCGEVN